MTSNQFVRYNNCFACGKENPIGMRIDRERADGKSLVSWTPRSEFEGYHKVLHGGIVCTLLDEAMAHAALSLAPNCATAEMKVRFREPVRTDEPLEVAGEVVDRKWHVLYAEARVIQGGRVKATATGKFASLPEGKK